MIKISHLIKDYTTRTATYRALKGIDLTLPDVQFVSILGPSGCGKTTLLNLIGGLDSISAGDILVDGKSIKAMTKRELDLYRNENVGFIFQDYFLVPQLTVLENAMIGLQIRGLGEKESRDKALTMLDRVGIADLKDKKPNELSGGQMQRAAIARALVTDPRIILADEPTGALDSVNSEEIMRLLKQESRQRLVVLVTHNERLAQNYSDRIVHIVDGEVKDDEIVKNTADLPWTSKKEKEKSHFPFLTAAKMAIRNIFQKKIKTILTCIANSFGLIGIGFLLALNSGFADYSVHLSRITASSLPVILTSYTTITDSESYDDVNSDTLYPDVDEIYPSVSTNSTSSYVFNNFTDKFFSFLDTLVDEGIASQYVINYGNSYSLNLTTEYPASIDGEQGSYVSTVNTTMTSYNSIASTTGLPTSIFHVLYGGLSDYDLLAGEAPTNEGDLILVVDQYNSVDFDILKNLGFYNYSDTENDVKEPNSKTKVKPISFSDILGKEYKVFSNDIFYSKLSETTETDAFGNERNIQTFQENDAGRLFESDEGQTLRIVGIYRPKEDNEFGLLSPSLCYLPGMQDDLVVENERSEMASAMKGNVLFSPGSGNEAFSSFLSEMNDAVKSFVDGDSTVLPTSQIRAIMDRYFAYADIETGTLYTLSSMVSEAKKLGVDLIPENLKGLSLSDSETAVSLLEDVQEAMLRGDFDSLYSAAIGLCAYVNAFSLIDYVTILPTSLSTRRTILERLDSFNEIQPDSVSHASSLKEQVFYSSLNASRALEQVGEVIDMTSLILIVFACISVVVSSVMTAVLMMNNVLERRREIGLLRSLGARKIDILSIFQMESLIVGLFTGLFGSLATYALTFPVNALIDSTFPYYGADNIASFSALHVLVLLLFALVVSLVSSFVPALKAARQDPVKCLRSE